MNGTGIEVSNSAEAVPSALDIPTEPKAFEVWCRLNDWLRWPDNLFGLAIKGLQALQARTFPEWDEPSNYEERRKHKANWSAFTTAYREHVGVRS